MHTKPEPTHWLTINEEEWHLADYILHNECEEWWNPEEGEFPVVNPTKQFIYWCELHSLHLHTFDNDHE